MISNTSWRCPPGLIEQALKELPVDNKRTALNEPTGNFFYDAWQIKEEFKGTIWEEILSSLPYNVGEARIITLEPGESYMAHADIDDRWHLNLQGEESYLIDLEEIRMYKQVRDNKWRHMNAGKLHTASNYGSIPRLQLVVRELLRHSHYSDMISVTMEQAHEQHDFRYKFDNIFSPWLNHKNKEYELDNFAPNGATVTFKMARHLKDDFESMVSSDFKVTYA